MRVVCFKVVTLGCDTFKLCLHLAFFWTDDNTHPVSEESQPSTVTVLSHGDNPGFEGDETQVCEGRIVCEVTL